MVLATPVEFQSTRPVRGGTTFPRNGIEAGAISIHPPRAGRDLCVYLYRALFHISIHPPRAGRDAERDFLWLCAGISIHPPRAGRDQEASL